MKLFYEEFEIRNSSYWTITFVNIIEHGVQRIDSPPRGVPWATFIVYQTKQQWKMQQSLFFHISLLYLFYKTGQWLIVKHHAVLNK